MAIPVQDGLLQIFDVEHGACALLTSPCPGGFRRLMIDCGHKGTWSPGVHLRSLGISLLDELVITNYDEDHVSGFGSFAANDVAIDWIARNTSVSAEAIIEMKREGGLGSGMQRLVATLPTYGPPHPAVAPPAYYGVSMETFRNPYPVFGDENNLSLVVYLTILGKRFLFPGDMECAGFEALLESNERFRAMVSAVDVLIAPHHGRESGICPQMFDVYGCKPRLVVISDDCKKYASQETVAYYASKCVGIDGFRKPGVRKVLSTRNDGELIFAFAGPNCVVH